MEHIGTQLKRHIKSVILDILVTNMTNHFTDKMSWKGMSSQNINFFSVCENCGKSYHRQDVLERTSKYSLFINCDKSFHQQDVLEKHVSQNIKIFIILVKTGTNQIKF